jgi:Holliday junction resolvase-like predicted endonuclease
LLRFAPQLFLRYCRPSNAELGEVCEELAARWLADSGAHILGRRVKASEAEIDVVVRVGETLVCVEVKGMRTDREPRELRFRPGGRLDRERLHAQQRAGRWLARRLQRGALQGGRVDVCEVFVRSGGTVRIEHHGDLREPLG